MQHISFPHIGQFRDAIKQVRDSAKYHQVPVPTVKFKGTTKMHGTNSAVCISAPNEVHPQGQIWYQSRERVITPENDNAGFAMWAYKNRQMFLDIASAIFKADHFVSDVDSIQIYGEWCGGNIQKGVGLNQVPKMFVVFAVRISENAESQNWIEYEEFVKPFVKEDFKYIQQFPTWEVEVDFTNPELIQNELVRITEEIEAKCPVAAALLGDTAVGELVGEGAVWTAIQPENTLVNVRGLRMKVKGEKHSVSKVKTIAAVDVERVNSIKEFVESVVTENRLNQGLDKLREAGLDSTDTKNTGPFIKWVVGDILREELDVIAENGFTTKDVTGGISVAARNFYLNQKVA